MTVEERARKYVSRMDPSISGSGGHNACFAAACVLVKGFDLPESLAMQILQEEFNTRCAPAWSEKELRHKIRQAERANSERGYLLGSRSAPAEWKQAAPTAAKVAEPVKKGQKADEVMIGRMVLRGWEATELWLKERSPIDVREIDSPELFLGHLYQPGEKALVFTSEYSQGDFGFFACGGVDWPGEAYRLGNRPSVPAEKMAIPRSGRCGVWYLANPVDGKWKPNGSIDKESGEPVLSRRSAPNVTAWRYMLLESDTVESGTWLNVLCQLPLPVAALYTSGKRSIHALLRMEAKTQEEMQGFAEVLAPVLAKLGGDWKAMTSVRLTRLPCCFREGEMVEGAGGKKQYQRFPKPREQRLLWLDPEPTVEVLLAKPRLRTFDGE